MIHYSLSTGKVYARNQQSLRLCDYHLFARNGCKGLNLTKMNEIFDVLEPDRTSHQVDAGAGEEDEEMSQVSRDSDFYSDEEDPANAPKKESEIIYVGDDEAEEAEDGGASSQDKQNDDDGELAIHNMLATPRLPPTPFDPPDYTPIVDRNRLLSAYRRLRDAYLTECERHKETNQSIDDHLDKIKRCKDLGNVRMGEQAATRKKQDDIIKEWITLEKTHKRREKELHKDINELATELVSTFWACCIRESRFLLGISLANLYRSILVP